jgi:phosphoserine phosphatase
MIAVFDFDKTLTKKDTLFGFYQVCAKKTVFKKILLVIYFGFMIVHKIRFISNDNLKRIGIILFLKGHSEKSIRLWAIEYSRKIEMKQISMKAFEKYKDPYIVSASFKEYISQIFPNSKIFASEILFDENRRVKGLKSNCFHKEKIKILKDYGILKIDDFYTDSIDDLPLAEISRQIYLVKKNKIIDCEDLNEFIRFCKGA